MKLKSIFMLAAVAMVALINSNAVYSQNKTDRGNNMSKSLVVYFSLAGDQYNVGVISEGNTKIIAKMISEKTGSDLFELETVRSYTTTNHNTLIKEAKDEQQKKARPELKADKDISAYDTIYIGYPNWWGDLPMCVYTFLEAHDWKGKTVIPFCTHEGSGLGSTESKIKAICKGATVLKGLAVQGKVAQTNRVAAEKAVDDWLKKVGK